MGAGGFLKGNLYFKEVASDTSSGEASEDELLREMMDSNEEVTTAHPRKVRK